VTVLLSSAATPHPGATDVIFAAVDRPSVIVCTMAIRSTAPSSPEQALLVQWPALVRAALAEEPEASRGAGAERDRSDRSQRPEAPRLPAPSNEQPMPTAPGFSFGSGSPGGSQSGSVLGVLAAQFGLGPQRAGRVVTLNERRRRPLHLFFFLERPG
jgi:hypothetical protein